MSARETYIDSRALLVASASSFGRTFFAGGDIAQFRGIALSACCLGSLQFLLLFDHALHEGFFLWLGGVFLFSLSCGSGSLAVIQVWKIVKMFCVVQYKASAEAKE